MAAGVEVRGCSKTLSLCPAVKPAADSDYGQEFLSLILAVKIVRSIEEAMEHIARYGSRHTEAIVTTGLRPGLEIFERGRCRRRAGQCVYTAK